MAIYPFTLILLLALCATSIFCADVPTYDDFVNKHIMEDKEDMVASDCDDAIMNRGIKEKEGVGKIHYFCKDINTFILTTEANVENICQTIKDGDLNSSDSFVKVKCKWDGKSEYPICRHTAEKSKEKIKVKCMNGQPVHLYY
ncbi:hypothetical protein SRHO_G00286240 [Serrasalmus rhombeus]